MLRQVGSEREHFGGENGLYTEIAHGKPRYFWRCKFCNWELGGKNFQNENPKYLINEALHSMIRDSPHNVKPMVSQQVNHVPVAAMV